MDEQRFKELLAHLPIAFGLHKIILNESGIPIDYVFLDINKSFEEYTGLKKADIIGKTVTQVLPGITESEFDWISYYGSIAISGGTDNRIQFSSTLNRTYKVTVYSPEQYYFITLFTDDTLEQDQRTVLSKVLQQAPIPIMIHAEDGEVIELSDTWTDISGYSKEDIPTIQEWTKQAYGTKQDEVISFIEHLYGLKKRQHDGEFLIRAKNQNQYLWDFYSMYIGRLPDNRKMAMSVALDVTDRNKLEQDLIAEKRLLELTLLSVGDGVITTDASGNVMLLNGVAETLTGWTMSDAIGLPLHTVFEIYSEKTNERCTDVVEKVISTGQGVELENHTFLLAKDGTSRPIADSAAPIIKSDGEIIGVIIVFRDYTQKYKEKVRIESLVAELRDMQILLESSLNSAKDILILSLDTNYKYLYFNKTHQADMRKAYNTEVRVGDCIFDYMTSEEDILNIRKNYDIALSGKSHTTLEQYGDKVVNYYENKFNPIYDDNGDVIGLTVFAENVTDRVEMEHTIKANERRYRELINTLDEGVIIHSENTTIISSNQRASDLLGINNQDLNGLLAIDPMFRFVDENLRPMKVKDYPVNLIRKTKAAIQDYVVGITHNDTTNITWLLVNGVPLLDENENILEIVISFRDISEDRRIKAELEYAAYNDFLTGLHNRRYYEEQLDIIDVESNHPITIIMADINGLKLLNDAFGHNAGDDLLVSAAALLKTYCRKRDLLARIGGDEFVYVMPNTTEKEAAKIISRIKAKTKHIIKESIPLSISFGYSSKRESHLDIRDVFRTAEDLMYREKLLEIPSMRSSAIEAILNTLYEKDPQSEIHSRAVSELSQKLALAVGMDTQDAAEVRTAGLLHDIGKIIISTSIINKKGLLTKEEYEVVKGHPEIGFRILNSTQTMRSISNIILSHHERWDGSGYPRGIAGKAIPLKARIISIADAFDAMTSVRTYRDVLSKEEALKEIMANAGTQFDPELAHVFQQHFDVITEDII